MTYIAEDLSPLAPVDLRSALGEEYDSVMSIAGGTFAINEPTFGRWEAMEAALEAVVPQLLARAYARGYVNGAVDSIAKMVDPQQPSTPSPYHRQKEDD